MEINIKLNEEVFFNLMTKMDNHMLADKHMLTDKHSDKQTQSEKQLHIQYFTMYIHQEMSKGMNEFQASVKFLMDEKVPQKYKDTYRKNQNQIVDSMDLDDFPDPPKLVRS